MKEITKYLRLSVVGAAVVATGCFTSCKKDEFKVNGNIEGGADRSVVLEKASFDGRWMAVDSARVGSNGKFEIESACPSAPEIYRLALGDRYIYLPVDSTETLTVNAKAADFGREFTVTGSAQAENMANFEKELMALNFDNQADREAFKKTVYSKYLKDSRGGILSYYVLTKTVGDTPLYDITDEADTKYYAAVATAYEQFRPTDPHTRMLRQASIEALKRKNAASGRKRVVEADEMKYPEITLPDENGKDVKLSDVMGHGKKGVLIVSPMNEKESPVINKALSDIYGGGAYTFYMVSPDGDQYAWREAARNLPWITVTDPDARNSDIIIKYNIGALPAFFIFSPDGDLVDRAFSIDELKQKL